MSNLQPGRRRFIKSSAFGIMSITAFGTSYAGISNFESNKAAGEELLFYRYPSMNDTMVSSVVGAAHSDFDKVKELVSARPELAIATWDWGFGDWESAIGAASHVGRRDIAELLIQHGARPDIFTMAMMGSYKAVEEMVEAVPGIQSIPGPHGITLLQHAKNRLRIKDISADDAKKVNKVIAYLEKLGNADPKPKTIEITEVEQKKYIGEYRFGKEETEVFIVDVNSRKTLQIGRKGNFGRGLNRVDENTFYPGGAPSVKIRFTIKENKATSLTIHEPTPIVTASRI